MIDSARAMALDYLVGELAGDELPVDVENWYQNLRHSSPGRMFPYLVEDSGTIGTAYVVERCADDLVRLSTQDIVSEASGFTQECTSDKLPFMRPPGSQSPQVGPVLKRSYDKMKGGGPSEKILITTMNYFEEVAKANKPWSPYFKDILGILKINKLQILGEKDIDWLESGYANMLACAVDQIGPQSGTVILTVRDSLGLLPGENTLYVEYLLTEKLAGERYATLQASAQEKESCYLCGAEGVTVYPNALRGAGINLSNVDRAGAFPGINTLGAWKRFALCGSCADLLYIYKFHVLKKTGAKGQLPYSARIAGDNALVVPSFMPGLPVEDRLEVINGVTGYIGNISADVEQDEYEILELLKDKRSVLNLLILWADIGQEIANVTGMINNVLPSRLKELSEINAVAMNWKHPLFPKAPLLQDKINFKPDLSLRALRPLFLRPGGKKAENANKSKNLFQLKRLVAASVYHQSMIPEDRFWDEIITTARWYWLDALGQKDGHMGLIFEGIGKKGPYLTAAGWIRHLNWWLYYFKQVGCMKMETKYFEPDIDELKPYFGPESNINTNEKAFAFLLGVLYGKLLQVQGARGVNVGANALSWLKRLTLQGSDLPELYTKIREKLLAYETEKNEKVRNLIREIGHLGVKLGDSIKLSETQTNYYLLLGQSLTTDILPKEESKNRRLQKFQSKGRVTINVSMSTTFPTDDNASAKLLTQHRHNAAIERDKRAQKEAATET